jgi:uncharacterized protein
MNKIFIDANILLRFLTNDVPAQANVFRKLVLASRNEKVRLVTNEIVIAEIIWTLKSYYKFAKKDIKEIVSPVVASDDMVIQNRSIILNALEDFVELNVDFNDAYIYSWMQENGIKKIATFNEKHFKRFRNIEYSLSV